MLQGCKISYMDATPSILNCGQHGLPSPVSTPVQAQSREFLDVRVAAALLTCQLLCCLDSLNAGAIDEYLELND